MEISQRELSLQRIIKSQELRIKELEAELAKAASVQQLENNLREANAAMGLKDKELNEAKQELARSRREQKESREALKTSKIHEHEVLLAENRVLAQRLKDVQFRAKSEIYQLQQQIQAVLAKNSILQREVDTTRNNQASIELEIQKLQIFYRNALSDLPRKLQTVSWVDDLLRFINKYQDTMTRQPLKECTETLKSQFDSFRLELQAKAKEMGDQFHQKNKQLNKIKQQINSMQISISKACKQVVEENTSFWEVAKKDKSNRSSQTERQLAEKLEAVQAAAARDKQAGQRRIKELESERREILMGFQELKNYFDSREKVYREQISTLKKGSQRLMEIGQKRESALEQELVFLRAEVETLNQKYRDNVRLPFEEFNVRFREDLRRVVADLDNSRVGAGQDKITNTLDRLDNKIREVDSMLQKLQDKQSTALATLQDNVRQLQSVETNICSNIDFLKDTLDRNMQDSSTAVVDYLYNSEQAYDSRANVLELEQLEARKNYEIGVLQRNYSRLTEINNRLQKQQQSGVRSQQLKISTAKEEQLEAENMQLKSLKEQYERKFFLELKRLRFGKYDKQLVTMMAENLARYQEILKNILGYCQSTLMPVIDLVGSKNHQCMLQIRGSYREIEGYLSAPSRKILNVIAQKQQVDELQLKESSRRNTTRQSITPLLQMSSNSKSSEEYARDVAVFKDYVTQYRKLTESFKHEPNTSVSKSLTEVISLLKSSLTSSRDTHKSNLTSISIQNQELQQQRKRTTTKSTSELTLEKRLKQIQNIRLKEKNDFAQAIEKVSQQLKKLESRKSIDRWVQEYSTRTEALIKEAVEAVFAQIDQVATKSARQTELHNICRKALEDIENKLKETLISNEGLVREMKLLTGGASTDRQAKGDSLDSVRK